MGHLINFVPILSQLQIKHQQSNKSISDMLRFDFITLWQGMASQTEKKNTTVKQIDKSKSEEKHRYDGSIYARADRLTQLICIKCTVINKYGATTQAH